MFRRAPRRHRRSFPLAFQSLEPRLAMASDFSYAAETGTLVIKADEAKYAEVSVFTKGPSVDSLSDLSKAPFLDSAGKHVAHLVDLHDRMEGLEAVKQAEEAGLSRDIERESKLVDPATGDPLDVQRGKATGFDSGLPGAFGVDLLGNGSESRLTDPRTGQPLLGGDGGATGPSQDDAMSAGRAGKGRAMDGDDGVVTNNTPVAGGYSFFEAWTIAKGTPGFVDVDSPLGPARIMAGGGERGSAFVYVEYEVDGKTQKELYVEGEEGPKLLSDQKPRPDDDSGTPPRKLTDAEKEVIRKELRGSFGPAGQPRPDDDGGSAGGYQGAGEVFTYLDLAGQPRPDDEGPYGGVAPSGPIMTGLGLAGQPVDDDPNFGVITPKFGGHVPANPVFGGVPPRP